MAVDTLGLLLAVHITPANAQERTQLAELACQVQHVTAQTVKLALADQGHTGDRLRRPLAMKVCNCRSSNCLRQRKVSRCCPAAG